MHNTLREPKLRSDPGGGGNANKNHGRNVARSSPPTSRATKARRTIFRAIQDHSSSKDSQGAVQNSGRNIPRQSSKPSEKFLRARVRIPPTPEVERISQALRILLLSALGPSDHFIQLLKALLTASLDPPNAVIEEPNAILQSRLFLQTLPDKQVEMPCTQCQVRGRRATRSSYIPLIMRTQRSSKSRHKCRITM